MYVLQNIGPDTFFVTMDVEALCTYTDHQQGLEAHFLSVQYGQHQMPPTDFFLSLAE